MATLTAASAESAAPPTAAAEDAPRVINRRKVAAWEILGFVVIFFAGSFLHFIFELSGFNTLFAPFGSVNESTWEHLKLFYWPALLFAVVQHAFIRHEVNNFWAAKAHSIVLTPLVVAIAFYAYVGIVVPIDGKGTLAGTLVTAAIGVALGQWASYRLLVGPQRSNRWHWAGVTAILAMGVAFIVFTFLPPRIFLFENFFGYVYDGQFGILADYTPYLVFK
ncbi:MAG TPA: DUF6512 family protein [Candidatus Limnocylindrales bacterium]|nr:DUF6512 family protein [Candidatus Limnocylindrales bacterium]